METPSRKPLIFVNGSIKSPPFTKEGRIEAGRLLRRLQEGESLGMPHSRPMRDVGPKCHELRVADEEHNWRIMYYLDTTAVVVLDVFPKATRKTPKAVIDKCARRLATYLDDKRAAEQASLKKKGD
ncbi:transposase [Fimbriiglobus ruber]|uniref:Transposase n=1 Tax=Fimbriiglobus ruber TaxID=1908690 RepID=A0A225D4L3_9BACT|nr:transposase [Fimbriiglobus ruber]